MEPPSGGQMGQLEKAITVYGQPENCSAACRRILEVMAEEAKSVGKDQEISLKILAHNNLIGRIIGKQGATIKKIMEVGEYDLNVNISSVWSFG
jgi:insulin-like growth factor 2 mRNA-binding protein 1